MGRAGGSRGGPALPAPVMLRHGLHIERSVALPIPPLVCFVRVVIRVRLGHSCPDRHPPVGQHGAQLPGQLRKFGRQIRRLAQVVLEIVELERRLVEELDQLPIRPCGSPRRAASDGSVDSGSRSPRGRALRWDSAAAARGSIRRSAARGSGAAATSQSVGSRSAVVVGSWQTVAGFTTPGQRTIIGTRMPPS